MRPESSAGGWACSWTWRSDCLGLLWADSVMDFVHPEESVTRRMATENGDAANSCRHRLCRWRNHNRDRAPAQGCGSNWPIARISIGNRANTTAGDRYVDVGGWIRVCACGSSAVAWHSVSRWWSWRPRAVGGDRLNPRCSCRRERRRARGRGRCGRGRNRRRVSAFHDGVCLV